MGKKIRQLNQRFNKKNYRLVKVQFHETSGSYTYVAHKRQKIAVTDVVVVPVGSYKNIFKRADAFDHMSLGVVTATTKDKRHIPTDAVLSLVIGKVDTTDYRQILSSL